MRLDSAPAPGDALAHHMPPHDPETAQWFTREVRPHESALRSYLRGKFPAHPDIDDLVQETYARLLQAREHGALQHPKAFLFATARNAAFDYFRRRKIVTIDGIENLELLPVLEDRPGVPEAVAHDQELQLLAAAIEALPARCRQVLTLRKIFGLSHREIAAQLHISEHTVNAQIAIGVLRLRDYLKQRGVTKGGAA
jgi:RNA polymerase sigma-70 factor (ECF subfamily)